MSNINILESATQFWVGLDRKGEGDFIENVVKRANFSKWSYIIREYMGANEKIMFKTAVFY
ncbi:MAG: hypothetical protein PHN55_06475 [Dysgonamonadaceae bacterium]|nr:hypothetical protein [Dysgonamonadaceae bacterium]